MSAMRKFVFHVCMLIAAALACRGARADEHAPGLQTPSASSEEVASSVSSEEGVAKDATPPLHTHPHRHVVEHSHTHAADEPHGAVTNYGARALVSAQRRAASTQTLTLRDLPRGAHVVPADLLRAVPGLYVAQHAGGGKANQLFLRGFDADHGTDVALSVDGVPVNMVSHGHGQGYADLNWVIPELVQRVHVAKGPYDPRQGDFATAGAVDLDTSGPAPAALRASVEGGSFGSYRGLLLGSGHWSGVRLTAAAELFGTDGPFLRPERLKRGNLFVRLSRDFEAGELSVTGTHMLSSWNAAGQIPLRAVSASGLSRFGSVDPYEGGATARSSLYARFRSPVGEAVRFEVLAYALRYRFSLYSDFTFFSDDPEQGDMIHQHDDRSVAGGKLGYERDDALGPFTASFRAGASMRDDRIDNGLRHAPRRSWGDTVVDDAVRQTSAGMYVEQQLDWRERLRATVALRGDGYWFAVRDTLASNDGARGERTATRLSPRGGLVGGPFTGLSLFAHYGYGFHSNDARGVVLGATPLTQARGAELGAVYELAGRTRLKAALFRLDLDSELVWIGDAGTNEPRGATRRDGLELDGQLTILPWLRADASFTWVRARFREGEPGARRVPLAPPLMLTGKLTAEHASGLFGRVGVITLGARPATEDGFLTAQGFTLVNVSAGYRASHWEASLAVENLLNTRWREAQFATVSRLPGETDASACPAGTRAAERGDGVFAGCEDVSFTAGAPIAVRGQLSLYY
jgi:hypothetical protein